MAYIQNLSWGIVIMLCLTIGLSPFMPPHIVEKLQMLFYGELKKTIDWLDLMLHGAPWILLIVKAVLEFKK